MKNLLVLAVLMSSSVMAGERVILKDQKAFDVEVSQKTVLCSAKGYGLAELKINIKDLDGWTLFDHSNIIFGDLTGLPCMTAGACSFEGEDGLSVDDVIQNNPRTEKIVVFREVIEARNVSNNDNDKICLRSLMEKIHTTVGGVKFYHQRGSNLEKRPLAFCKF